MSIIKHHSSYSVTIGGNYYESNSFDRVCQAEEQFKQDAFKSSAHRLINDEGIQDLLFQKSRENDCGDYDDQDIDED